MPDLRRLLAGAAGLVAGGIGFAGLIALGLLLYQRLWADSPIAFPVLILSFGAAGLYAGWLVGVIVFSALRGRRDP